MADSLKKHDEKMESFSSRLKKMENCKFLYENYGHGDGYYENSYYIEGRRTARLTGIKRIRIVDNDKKTPKERSSFESIAEKFQKIEHVEAKINDALAENLNEVLTLYLICQF